VDAAEMNRFGAQWKTALEFGTDASINSTFYQPLGYGSDAFFAPRLKISQETVDLFTPDTNDRIAEYRVRRVAGGLDLVYDFGTFAEVRGGVEWGNVKADRRTGDPEFPDLNERTGAFVGQVRVDQLDNVTIPKNGYFARVDFRAERPGLGAPTSFDRFEASVLGAKTFDRFTVVGRGKWGDPLGTDLRYYEFFQLGGLFQLSGYAPNQLFGRSYGLFEGIFYYRLARGGAILQATYLGGSVEGGNVWNDTPRTFSNLKAAGSVFLAAETVLGPFYFGYGYAGSKHKSFYILLARYF
jgi:NTE family protein